MEGGCIPEVWPGRAGRIYSVIDATYWRVAPLGGGDNSAGGAAGPGSIRRGSILKGSVDTVSADI